MVQILDSGNQPTGNLILETLTVALLYYIFVVVPSCGLVGL